MSSKLDSSIKVLINIFDREHGLEIYNQMKPVYSTKEAIQWLKNKAKQFIVDKKLFKELNETGRLLPTKTTLFGNKYTKQQLMQYYLETKPR